MRHLTQHQKVLSDGAFGVTRKASIVANASNVMVTALLNVEANVKPPHSVRFCAQLRDVEAEGSNPLTPTKTSMFEPSTSASGFESRPAGSTIGTLLEPPTDMSSGVGFAVVERARLEFF